MKPGYIRDYIWRSNDKSSLEQVVDLISAELITAERFVSINDTKYIPGMQKYAKSIGMDDNEMNQMISKIRLLDRAVQGITP